MALVHEAVLTKPASRGALPVSFSSFETLYPWLPSVALTRGSGSSLSPALSVAPAPSLLIDPSSSVFAGTLAWRAQRHRDGNPGPRGRENGEVRATAEVPAQASRATAASMRSSLAVKAIRTCWAPAVP